MAAAKRVAGEAARESSKRFVRRRACQSMLRQTLADEFGEIVGAFVRAAKKGSAAHMKLTTDLLNEGSGSSVCKRSARKMLKELELDD